MADIAFQVVVILLLLLVVNGVCSMSEMAMVASHKVRLEHLAGEGDEGARAALEIASRQAWDIDLTPEGNVGSGPVDFKMSRGYGARVLVELERSSSSRLAHG